jgi:hypothetical protein
MSDSASENEDSIEELIKLIEEQSDLLIAVSTGGPAFDTVDHEYRERYREIARGLSQLGLDNPFPWRDLWRWYGYYSANLPGYAARRVNIRERTDSVLEQLERRLEGKGLDDETLPGENPNWASAEGRLTGMKRELASANSHDDFQDVGRRCREILIEIGMLLYDERMLPSGCEPPSRNDAKARIGYYLDAVIPGPSSANLRRVLRAAYDLMQTVTHGASVTFVDAFAAGQATVFLARTLQMIERNKSSMP